MDSTGPIVHSPSSLAPESPFRPEMVEDGGTIHQRQFQDSPRVEASGPIRRRKASKNAAESVLKRSASTPNVRSATQSDMPSSILNDKKRNKLGYHRTSVACVHCRRRKIRCLLAPDDPQNRCANCIRLKKECNFYPVDQQPPQERRPRAGSKTDIKSNGNSSSSSSPGFTAGTSTEYGDNYNSIHGTPISANPYAMSFHSNESATFSPPGSAAPFATHFDFSGQRQHWDHGNQYDQPYIQEEHRGGYWAQPETPVSPAYPYSSIQSNDALPTHDTNPPHTIYGVPRTSDGIHPTRSMSYSQVETLAHDNDPYHNHAPIFVQEPQHRRTSEVMAPPSLRHSASSSMVSINEVIPSTYAGAPAMTLAQAATMPYAWGSQAMVQSSQSSKATDFNNTSTAWQYGEQSQVPHQLPKVQEEQEAHPHFVGEPTVLYSNVPHH